MGKVLCPKCGAENEEAAEGSPFFCRGCRSVVDPSGRTKSAVPSPRAGPAGAEGPRFVSQYDTTKPLTATGPGAGFSVGGSRIFGYVLAAIAAGAVSGGLAFAGITWLYVPILYSLLTGWAIKRSLAIGSGGGTPDRGPLGVLVLLAIVVGGFGVARYVEYRDVELRESRHYRAVFGANPFADVDGAIRRLAARDTDGDGLVEVNEDGIRTTVVVADEDQRLRTAAATGRRAERPYDIELLAATGRTGFLGHLQHLAQDGTTFRFRPADTGHEIPGLGVLALWLAEFVVMVVAAFLRIES